MGIEEQIDRLIDLGEDIKSRLDLLVELASDHFAGANKMVVDEPAKEPEHLAGPKPDPGEGYRILSKDPLEDLTPGDEFEDANGEWIRSSNAEKNEKQGATCWYRRKIETAKQPEPEYREPVLPADAGKACEFSDDSISWEEGVLIGWRANFNTFNWKSERDSHRYARIKKDA